MNAVLPRSPHPSLPGGAPGATTKDDADGGGSWREKHATPGQAAVERE